MELETDLEGEMDTHFTEYCTLSHVFLFYLVIGFVLLFSIVLPFPVSVVGPCFRPFFRSIAFCISFLYACVRTE